MLGDLTAEVCRITIEFILSLSKESDARFNHGERLAESRIGVLGTTLEG